MTVKSTDTKTNIEELLNGIDRQLLMKLLDALVQEQIPDIQIGPKEQK